MKKNIFNKGFTVVLLSLSLSFLAYANVKPTVSIYATGGTIAGSSTSSTDTTNYKAGSLGIDVLMNAVPELKDIAFIKGEQIASVDSNSINQQILLALVKKLNHSLSDPEEVGAVITHGTDTLEETAFFLDLTMKTEKPIVLVGAMRPATALSADGPMNLLEAVRLATDVNAKGRGVMVVLNDRIGSGFYITKTNSIMLDTFKSVEQGYLGAFFDGMPTFYYSPAVPTNKPYFDVTDKSYLPKVVVLYSYQDMNDQLLYDAVEKGARGIVLAASGNGSLPEVLKKAVEDLMDKGIPIILSSKTGAGFVTPKSLGVGSGIYSPTKSKILLSLALASGDDITKIREYFEGQ